MYYLDGYLTGFTAQVVGRTEDGFRIYLNRTAFYPSSGGQPNDLGSISGCDVVDVVDEESRIAHILASPFPSDSAVQALIDWSRRYDHMQQHTGQHLLSAVLSELFRYPTLSFHLGAHVSTIEIGATDLAESQIDEAEARANQVVREARQVTVSFEDAESVAGLRKPSERQGSLRIIEITGFDRSACGGTHVRSTAELGPIFIRKTEKLRGNVRLEFVCGNRALGRSKQDFRIAQTLAKLAATQIDALPEYFESLRTRLAGAEKALRKLELQLARYEGEEVYTSTAPSADGIRRIRLVVGRIDEAIRAKAEACISKGKAAVLISDSENTAVLLACSSDSGLNAGAILKLRLTETGGRGGGSQRIAQGSIADSSVLARVAEDAGFPK